MTQKQCKYHEKCNAPICPLDPRKENLIWYSDEAICKNKDFQNTDFIKNQKKIANLNKRHDVQGLFTFQMLNRPLIVKRGFSGLNEDISIEDMKKTESAWIKRHKGISKELKEKYQSNLAKRKMEVKENGI